MVNGSGIPQLPWIVLDFFFFGTENVLEKGYFTRIVLELFLNLEFFISKAFSVAPFLKTFLDMHIKGLILRHNMLNSRLL